ncbi:hypothetical protein BDZ89DRAFT_1046800 [Hymenopellis radicata]|nr:hypothetical protein BDZ89DRAFT_1046800 [Hymenopellis radicata]
MQNPNDASSVSESQNIYLEKTEVYFTRRSQSAIPSKYSSLYKPVSSSAQLDAVTRHLFSLKFPSQPSTRLDLDADIAYQCILAVFDQVSPSLPPPVKPRLRFLSPLLMRWCIHFLGAISWQDVGANAQTTIPSPLLLLPALLFLDDEGIKAHDRGFLLRTLSVLLPMYVDLTLCEFRHDALPLVNGLVDVFYHYLYEDVLRVLSRISHFRVEAVVYRLALYVNTKSCDNIPVEYLAEVILLLSHVPAMYSLLLDLDAPRWVAHTLRLGITSIKLHRRYVCIPEALLPVLLPGSADPLFELFPEMAPVQIAATASYLSLLFSSEENTTQVVRKALARKLLPSLVRCARDLAMSGHWQDNHIIPVMLLMHGLMSHIRASPQTALRAKIALSGIDRRKVDRWRHDPKPFLRETMIKTT